MKILVSDFDKTLYTKDYQENIKAINDFVSKGNVFIVATGRNFFSITQDLDPDLKFDYLICNTGGVIYNNDYKPIYQKDLETKVIKPIFNILSKNPCVGNPVCDLVVKYKNAVSINANGIIARIVDRNKTFKMLDDLTQKFPQISGYLSDRWLNINDHTVSKGNAVKLICDKNNYDYSDLYVVGDNHNDVSMFEVGFGFAIENSADELSQVAIGTVKSVKELVEILK